MDNEKETIEILHAMKDKLDAVDITDTIITCKSKIRYSRNRTKRSTNTM